MHYSVIAGGTYGHRKAVYELIEEVLVLRDEGDQDNLARNGLAADFEGLTIEQAKAKAEGLNSEGSGHSYDGCHACTWSIALLLLKEDKVPPHLRYSDPGESFAIREALRIYRKGKHANA